MKTYYKFSILLLLSLNMIGCDDDVVIKNKRILYLKNRATGIRYYELCAFLMKPAVLSGEINESQAKEKIAYYKVQYNEEKFPIIFEKYVDGKLFFQIKYIYESDGRLQKTIALRSNGNIQERENK